MATTRATLSNPGAGWRRAFLRFPVLLFRLKLGWMMGPRYLLLTHRGRKTGRIYQNVLEVIDKNSDTGEIFILSGWGPNSNWYRNVRAGGAVSVKRGRRTFTPQVRSVTEQEAAEVHRHYFENHKLAARFALWLTGWKPSGDDPVEVQAARAMPVLALTPQGD